MTAQQEEKEDDMSVQESYTAKILRIAEESKQNKSVYRPLTPACPIRVMVERLFSDAKHIMTEDSPVGECQQSHYAKYEYPPDDSKHVLPGGRHTWSTVRRWRTPSHLSDVCVP